MDAVLAHEDSNLANCSSFLQKSELRKRMMKTCHFEQKCMVDTNDLVDFNSITNSMAKTQCDPEAYLFV